MKEKEICDEVCTYINRTWILFLDQFYARFHVTWNTCEKVQLWRAAYELPVN